MFVSLGLELNHKYEKFLSLFFVFVCFFLVPSDSPRNFVASAVSPTSIQLSWERPLTPNGEITNYTITYTTDDGTPAIPITTVNTTHAVGALNEYTNYTFSITSSTSAGSGPAATDTTITQEAGKDSVQGCI